MIDTMIFCIFISLKQIFNDEGGLKGGEEGGLKLSYDKNENHGLRIHFKSLLSLFSKNPFGVFSMVEVNTRTPKIANLAGPDKLCSGHNAMK